MHVALIGTYPPMACGIATFTADVERALSGADLRVTVFGVSPDANPNANPNDHPNGSSIVRDDRASYLTVAEEIRRAGCDSVLLQHEFGIFGGDDGDYVVELVEALPIPVTVTLHTVLSPFHEHQAEVIHRLCRAAAAVSVFTPTARRLLLEQELVHDSKIHVIPHGAPVEMYATYDGASVRRDLHLPADALVLATFGLLSPGKGIELALRALPAIVAAHPDAMYVIAGRTHPEVERRHGQAYRSQLLRTIDELGMHDHVTFIDRFLSVRELAQLLSITRTFVTPYVGSEQIVSGALTFALAAGCPVVSTPYRYACDVLAGGAGALVGFADEHALAAAVVTLLGDGAERDAAKLAAQRVGAAMRWPAVGRQIAEVLHTTIAGRSPETSGIAARRLERAGGDTQPSSLHLRLLTDDTAIIQHARGLVPRLDHGYCVDDAGRALPVMAELAATSLLGADAVDSTRWHVAIGRQLAMLRAATGGGGRMRNFMSWERRWLDPAHGGDHVGRAVWGLGELAGMETAFGGEATDLMHDILHGFDVPAAPPRTLAYVALGLLAAPRSSGRVDDLLQQIGTILETWTPLSPEWAWFEPRLTYDNARIPEVMMRVGDRLDQSCLVDQGIVGLAWLDRLCRDGDHYRFPGHLGVDLDRNVKWSGDEQPIEAAGMADAHAAHWLLTGSANSREAVDRAWSWFLGNNRLAIPVGDISTGACRDGLCSHDVNLNCGAESTIAFLRCARTQRLVAAGQHYDVQRWTRVPS